MISWEDSINRVNRTWWAKSTHSKRNKFYLNLPMRKRKNSIKRSAAFKLSLNPNMNSSTNREKVVNRRLNVVSEKMSRLTSRENKERKLRKIMNFLNWTRSWKGWKKGRNSSISSRLGIISTLIGWKITTIGMMRKIRSIRRIFRNSKRISKPLIVAWWPTKRESKR